MFSNCRTSTKFIFAFLSGIWHHLSMVHAGHDSSHFCFSKNPFLWKLIGYIGEVTTGHSMYVWVHRHVVAHHVYTNVAGIDPDIGIYKCSPHKTIADFKYRANIWIFPSWFQPFLYFFVVIQMQYDDFVSFWRKSMENSPIYDTKFKQTFIFYLTKFIFISHRLVLPIYFGNGILLTLSLFLVTEFIAGLLFGVFSQITHVQKEVAWPNNLPIDRDWGELQVETAADFCHDSKFWTYFTGYLNYQVLHHLFPSMAPHYYPEILHIVKDTSKEYKLNYLIFNSFWDCYTSHLNYLKEFQSIRLRHFEKVKSNKAKKSSNIFDKLGYVLFDYFGK